MSRTRAPTELVELYAEVLTELIRKHFGVPPRYHSTGQRWRKPGYREVRSAAIRRMRMAEEEDDE